MTVSFIVSILDCSVSNFFVTVFMIVSQLVLRVSLVSQKHILRV